MTVWQNVEPVHRHVKTIVQPLMTCVSDRWWFHILGIDSWLVDKQCVNMAE